MPEDAPGFCHHCDMPRAFCEHGMAKIPAPAILERSGPTIDALFTGTPCAGCGEKIHEGKSITMTPDGWAHSAEVESPSPSDKPPRTSPRTFDGI